MSAEVVIGVATDFTGWFREVVNTFDRARDEGVPVRTVLVDLYAHDWVRNAQGFDAIVWNPDVMGPISASFFKEKIYFLQHVMNVRVVPNWESAWHYESKVAQSYILEALHAPRPRTVVSFEREDAAASAQQLGLPVVAKKSYGAAGRNVMLLRTQRELDRYLEREFAQQEWDERRARLGSTSRAVASGPLSGWLLEKVRRAILGGERHGYVYLQEFIDGNDSDLRINVIGRRVAGCRRRNRAGDFRASGSGQVIRLFELPQDAVDLCVDIRERMGADCLAFDVLYRDGSPLIVEMSYVESLSSHAVHLVKEADGAFMKVEGEAWDQELWAKHVLEELGF